MSGLTTLDAAKGMQRRHAKLLRDIDRLRSILPPDFAVTAFIPDAQTNAAGNRQRFFHLTRNALPVLCMGQATTHEILGMAEPVRKLHSTNRAGTPHPGPFHPQKSLCRCQ